MAPGRPLNSAGGRQNYFQLWLRNFSLGLLLLVSFGIIMWSRIDRNGLEWVRGYFHDLSQPLAVAARRPTAFFRGLVENVRSYTEIRAENESLQRRILQLSQYESQVEDLEAENRELRRLVHLVDQENFPIITAEVISHHAGSYSKAAVLGAGSSSDVRKNMAVILDRGALVGRIVDVGRNTSRVLLLTDVNSRIPVILEGLGVEAILVGTNGKNMILDRLQRNVRDELKRGERVITSGAGGTLPVGLVVGHVAEVSKGQITVEPAVDWSKRFYMQIVDFNIEDFLTREFESEPPPLIEERDEGS